MANLDLVHVGLGSCRQNSWSEEWPLLGLFLPLKIGSLPRLDRPLMAESGVFACQLRSAGISRNLEKS
jgi:hypothetical protein